MRHSHMFIFFLTAIGVFAAAKSESPEWLKIVGVLMILVGIISTVILDSELEDERKSYDFYVNDEDDEETEEMIEDFEGTEEDKI